MVLPTGRPSTALSVTCLLPYSGSSNTNPLMAEVFVVDGRRLANRGRLSLPLSELFDHSPKRLPTASKHSTLITHQVRGSPRCRFTLAAPAGPKGGDP